MSRPSMWRWPIALAALSLVGLVSALVADGVWDALSWLTLGLPVVVCAWYAARRKSSRQTLR